MPGHFYSSYENHPASYNISLIITAKESGIVTVRTRGQNISIRYDITDGKTIISLPEAVIQAYGQLAIQLKGIRITSTVKISAKLIVAGKYSKSTSRRNPSNRRYSQYDLQDIEWYTFKGTIDLLPVAALTSKYIIPFSGNLGIHIVGTKKTAFSITCEQNGTSRVIQGKLRKFDSFLLNETFSSGIKFISSDSPVAVFYNALYKDRTEYQYVLQVSTGAAGRKYITHPDRTRAYITAVALDNGTIIEVSRGSRTYNMMVDEGEYIQSEIYDSVIALNSNKNLLVTRYKQPTHNNSQPAIAPVPALSHYCNGYVFEQDSDRYLNVVVESDRKDEFMFHERDVPYWQRMSYIVMNGTEYFVAQTMFTKGEKFRKIHLRNRNAKFGGFLDIVPLGICK